MSKYIDKVEQYKQKVLGKALEKLESEYANAEDMYTDSGYDRYYNKMQKCEREIEEIKQYLEPVTVHQDIIAGDYKELLELREKMKNIKAKLFYLEADFPQCADIINLKDMVRDY